MFEGVGHLGSHAESVTPLSCSKIYGRFRCMNAETRGYEYGSKKARPDEPVSIP